MSAPSLAAWGILRPDDVVTVAAAVGLPLAAACALLEQESAGGRNVFGHDPVPTGGAYAKGDPVTEVAYKAYRHALALGLAGQQGVGPCQLTAREYQDRADTAGGCWDPVPNMRVGFALLATYARQWGLADAARAYNGGAGNRHAGSNAHADEYSSGFMDKYARWLDRLGHAPAPEDDMPLTDQDVDRVATAVVARLLGTQLADLYPDHPSPTQTMTVAATWQWAAANAGRALYVARAVLDGLGKAAPGTPVGDVNQAIRAALDALGPLKLIRAEEPGQ